MRPQGGDPMRPGPATWPHASDPPRHGRETWPRAGARTRRCPVTCAPRRGPARPWLVPEVLQTSPLDCGPAALAALLAGFGVEPSFDRLRDACRTGRDGTSIDAIESAAVERGLDAEQILVPAAHLLLPEAACLPCILVVRQAGGATHFVVLWRRHGRHVQLMDPAAGRRWPTLAALEREVYRHRAVVPAAA